MKITWKDVRRVHSRIDYTENGERSSDDTWGDIRTVSVRLEPGEVPDIVIPERANRGRSGSVFRAETAHLQWQRHRYWAHGIHTGWAPINRRQVDGWWLANAGIRGTNIKADGTVGKLAAAALYQNDDGWGRNATNPPEWFLEIQNRYDPANMPSRLDNEPTSLP